MDNYTLEEALDYVNSKLEEAYYEASNSSNKSKDILKDIIKSKIKDAPVYSIDDIDKWDEPVKSNKNYEFLKKDYKKAIVKYQRTHDQAYLDAANDLKKEYELATGHKMDLNN